MSDHVSVSNVNGVFVPYVNNMLVPYVTNVSVPYISNGVSVATDDNGTFFGNQSIFNCRLDSSENHLMWCENGKFGYYSDNGKLTCILNITKVALSEMISEQSFIFVYVEKPTQFVLHVNGNNRKTIETSEPIISLRFHSDRLAVIQINQILVFQYNENDISALNKITYYTNPNPFGLCEFKNKVIVFPETQHKRVLRIINIQDNNEKNLQLQQPREIICLALNQSGDLLAISFDGMPVFYIWSIIKDKQIFVLKTCTPMTMKLYNINFSADSKLVCCSTMKGEINVFHTDISKYEDIDDIDFRERIIYAFAYFRLPLRQPGICKFLTDDFVRVMCVSGNLYPYTYSLSG